MTVTMSHSFFVWGGEDVGSTEWQKVRIPLLERLALLDLAERRGETEEEALQRIIREAVRAECGSSELTEGQPGDPLEEVGNA